MLHGIIRAMSLATRCTACGTIFRVVQDQLKVSEGWVRCGRCQEVFNALEGLFDLERDPPPQRPQPRAAEPAPPAAVAATPAGDEWDSTQSESRSAAPAEEADLPATSESDVLDSRFLRRELDGYAEEPGDNERIEPDFADAQFPSELLQEGPPAVDGGALEKEALPRRIRGSRLRSRSKKLEGSSETASPQFVRSADRAARWRRPWVRAILAGLVLALMALLAVQMAYQWRDLLAAERPDMQPYLAQMCEQAGCQLQAPRRIDDLTVESSALVKADGSGDTYRLTVVLRNHGRLPVQLPDVDLSLTDTNGTLLARRALTPAEFRAKDTPLGAGGESTLQTLLATPGQRVAGYTVEIFYP